MKKLTLLFVGACTLTLAGCQNLSKTMFTHIRIDNMQTTWIAKGNAATNFCLSKNAINRQSAFDFSTTAAEFLDLVVFDNDFYKSTYEAAISEANSEHERNPNGTAASCKSFSDMLPGLTAQVTNAYRNYAQQLGVARSEEYQRLAQSMRNFQVPNTPIPQVSQPSFPNFNYTQEQSRSFNVLVNSTSGITQCRVTKSSFVFCL
jgi:hypothetical protein